MFSNREMKIIKILDRKKMSLKEISEKLFTGPNKPFFSLQLTTNSVTSIIKKCEYYKLTWTLIKTKEQKGLLIKKGKMKCLNH